MKNKIFFFICISLFSACKHELERPTWDVDLLVPLIHSQMSINDMLSDSAITINEDEDGFITLVFQEKFTDINLDTLINVEDTLGETKVVLDSITFKDVSISDTSTLGSLITQVPGGTLLFPDGSFRSIPDLPGIIQGNEIDVDASEYFESMTFHKGYLRINLFNGFPTDLANVDITLKDANNNNNTIASFNFALITSNSSVIDSVSLGGMTIYKDLIAILNNIDVVASNGSVLIDYEDA